MYWYLNGAGKKSNQSCAKMKFKAGDLVKLTGALFSSYAQKGEVGIVLGTSKNYSEPWDPALAREYPLVLWADGSVKSYRSDHMEAVNV